MQTRIEKEEFKKYFDFLIPAYEQHHIEDDYGAGYYRQDGVTPFSTHPIFAASLLLADRKIPLDERVLGYKILLLHDILEDTDQELPDFVEEEVKQGVAKMTYAAEAKPNEIADKIAVHTPFFKLLTLCDMISNMYEDHVQPKHQTMWKIAVEFLISEVEATYGDCRVVQIAKAVSTATPWENWQTQLKSKLVLRQLHSKSKQSSHRHQ